MANKYEGLVKEAIAALKERTGSSLPAIKKWLQANKSDELKGNWESILRQNLKKLTDSGKLVKVGAPPRLTPSGRPCAPVPATPRRHRRSEWQPWLLLAGCVVQTRRRGRRPAAPGVARQRQERSWEGV